MNGAAGIAGDSVWKRLRRSAAPFAKTALLKTGGYAAMRRLAPSSYLAILRYHAICGDEGHAYADPQICITTENFERHVAYLTQEYSVVRLDEAVRRIVAGKPMPPNAVAITFDDGYADNLEAARTLARYGASATFYITAGCLADGLPFWPAEVRYLVASLPPGRMALAESGVTLDLPLETDADRRAAVKQLTRTFKANPVPVRDGLRGRLRTMAGNPTLPRVMLTWDEVREMHRLGMTIGSHTMTHPNLPNAGVTRALEELSESKRRLEQEIDVPVQMFSYPNGGADRYMTPEIRRAVLDTGYQAATTSRNAFATVASDPYALERIEVQERLEDMAFALECERFVFKPRARRGEIEP